MCAQSGEARWPAIAVVSRIANELQIRGDREVIDHRDAVVQLGDLFGTVVQRAFALEYLHVEVTLKVPGQGDAEIRAERVSARGRSIWIQTKPAAVRRYSRST
jgi:hypothetical protein